MQQQHSRNSPSNQSSQTKARNGQKEFHSPIRLISTDDVQLKSPNRKSTPFFHRPTRPPSTMKLLKTFVPSVTVLLLVASSQLTAQEPRFQTKQQSDRVDLLQDGQLVTSYQFQSGTKPILWPLIGPDQSRMSREYPMADGKDEDHDHPHHRSLWMTFGEVNGFDFWAEGDEKNKGRVVHKEILSLKESESAASVTARHEWQTKSGQVILEETCRYAIVDSMHGSDDRLIDCEYILKHPEGASNEPIHFGDTKEGMFAVRVPETMRADKSNGQILNSNGLLNGATWGRAAQWVDYAGKVTSDAKSEMGVAILTHPKSFGSDGYWHVRTYGLFAHNPIGVSHFLEVNPSAVKKEGGYYLPSGASMHLIYRVILHRSRWTHQDGNQQYEAFAKSKPQLN